MLDPVSVAPTLLNRRLERTERLIRHPELRVGAGDVVEQHRIVGIYLHRALREFDGAFLVTNDCVADGAEYAGARIVRVELDVNVDQPGLLPVRCLSFLSTPKRH